MTCSRGCCPDQRTHYLSIGISATAMPSRKGPVIARLKSDENFSKDGPAYKRLVKQGYQPDHIDGCAEIEQRAESRVEVESMKVLDKNKRNKLEAITETSTDKMRIHEPNGLVQP